PWWRAGSGSPWTSPTPSRCRRGTRYGPLPASSSRRTWQATSGARTSAPGSSCSSRWPGWLAGNHSPTWSWTATDTSSLLRRRGVAWQDCAMSAMSERYDRAAERYGTWWAPVLEAAALRVLDRAAQALPQDEAPGGRSLAILD